MALEATFRTLSTQIGKLRDTLNAVLLTVGDRPPEPGAALADELENMVLDLMGSLEEARSAARLADKAVRPARDLDRARRALARCQDLFHRVEQSYASELVSYEKLRSLTGLGSSRGGEWKHWAASMKDAIEQARHPIDDTSKTLAACWQELAEHNGNTSISVRTKNLGQKIFTRTTQDVRDPIG
jgi:hypothetical protein